MLVKRDVLQPSGQPSRADQITGDSAAVTPDTGAVLTDDALWSSETVPKISPWVVGGQDLIDAADKARLRLRQR